MEFIKNDSGKRRYDLVGVDDPNCLPNKQGIAAYSKCIGAIALFFGFAIKAKDATGATVYLIKASALKYIKRHGQQKPGNDKILQVLEKLRNSTEPQRVLHDVDEPSKKAVTRHESVEKVESESSVISDQPISNPPPQKTTIKTQTAITEPHSNPPFFEPEERKTTIEPSKHVMEVEKATDSPLAAAYKKLDYNGKKELAKTLTDPQLEQLMGELADADLKFVIRDEKYSREWKTKLEETARAAEEENKTRQEAKRKEDERLELEKKEKAFYQNLSTTVVESQIPVLDMNKLFQINRDAFEEIFISHPEGEKRVQLLTDAQVAAICKNLISIVTRFEFLKRLRDPQLANLLKTEPNDFTDLGNAVRYVQDLRAIEKNKMEKAQKKEAAKQAELKETEYYEKLKDTLTDEQIPLLDMEKLLKRPKEVFKKIFIDHPEGAKRVSLLTDSQAIAAYKSFFSEKFLLNNFKDSTLDAIVKVADGIRIPNYWVGEEIRRRATEKKKLEAERLEGEKQEATRKEKEYYDQLGDILTNDQIPTLDMEKLLKYPETFKKIFIDHPKGEEKVQLLLAPQVLVIYKKLKSDSLDNEDKFLKNLSKKQLIELNSQAHYSNNQNITWEFQRRYREEEWAERKKIIELNKKKAEQEENYRTLCASLTIEQVPTLDMAFLVKMVPLFRATFISHKEGTKRVQALTDPQVLDTYNNLIFEFKLQRNFLKQLTDLQLENLSAVVKGNTEVKDEKERRNKETLAKLCADLTLEQIPSLNMAVVATLKPTFSDTFLTHFEGKKRIEAFSAAQVLDTYNNLPNNLQGYYKTSFVEKLTDSQLEQLSKDVTNYFEATAIREEKNKRSIKKRQDEAFKAKLREAQLKEEAEALQKEEEYYANLSNTITDRQIPSLNMEKLVKYRFYSVFKPIFIDHPEGTKRVQLLTNKQVLITYQNFPYSIFRQGWFLKELSIHQLSFLSDHVSDDEAQQEISKEMIRRNTEEFKQEFKSRYSKTKEEPIAEIQIPDFDLKKLGADKYYIDLFNKIKTAYANNDFASLFDLPKGSKDEKAISKAAREMLRKTHPDLHQDKPYAIELYKLIMQMRDVLLEKKFTPSENPQ